MGVSVYVSPLEGAALTEGGGNASTVGFRVSVSPIPRSGDSVSVRFDLFRGTAQSDADFTFSTSGPLIFSAGTSVRYVYVNVIDDTAFEAPETIILNVGSVGWSGPTYGTGSVMYLPGQKSASITIVDNDAAPRAAATIGNDTIASAVGDDAIDGLSGLDTVTYSSPRDDYVVTNTSAGFMVNGGPLGTDTLVNVERLKFLDASVALDVNGGHAGQVAMLLGAVFGAAAVNNAVYAGIGLHYLDAGMSYEALAGLAVLAAGKSEPGEVVELLWNNVVGGVIPTGERAAFVAMLERGMSVGALAVLAAETSLTSANIDLVGLSQTGLVYQEYLP